MMTIKIIGDNMVKLKGRHILKNVIDTEQPIDTILSLKDGKIGAHRIVLAAASPFLESLFQDQDSRVITLILPDISKKTMETLLHIAYTGKLIYLPNETDEVFTAMETLRFCENAELQLTIQQIFKKDELEKEEDLKSESDSTKTQIVSDERHQMDGKPGNPMKRGLSPDSSSCPISYISSYKRRRRDDPKDLERRRLKYESIKESNKNGIPTFFHGFNETTGKVIFNMHKLPEVSVFLFELPDEKVKHYMAKLEAENTKIKIKDKPSENESPRIPNPSNCQDPAPASKSEKAEEVKVNCTNDPPNLPLLVSDPEIEPGLPGHNNNNNIKVEVTTAMLKNEVPPPFTTTVEAIHGLCDLISDIQMQCCV